jgi:hypothetical protein
MISLFSRINFQESLYELVYRIIRADENVRQDTAKDLVVHIKTYRFRFGTEDALKDLQKFSEAELSATLAEWHEGDGKLISISIQGIFYPIRIESKFQTHQSGTEMKRHRRRRKMFRQRSKK